MRIRMLGGRRLWWAAAAGVAVVAISVVLAVLVPGRHADPLPVRAREYTDARVCLLTDDRGVTGEQAAPVWAGMQDASGETKAQVSFLSVMGPATVTNAQSYANTLVQRKCSVLLASGDLPVQALRAIAPANPKVRFIVVGDGISAANMTVLAASSQVRGEVAEVVKESGQG